MHPAPATISHQILLPDLSILSPPLSPPPPCSPPSIPPSLPPSNPSFLWLSRLLLFPLFPTSPPRPVYFSVCLDLLIKSIITLESLCLSPLHKVSTRSLLWPCVRHVAHIHRHTHARTHKARLSHEPLTHTC